MAENRLTRELDTRVIEERPKQWMPPELLPEPDKQAGYEYRWIRVSLMNQADPRNISAQMRQGWRSEEHTSELQSPMYLRMPSSA